MKPGMVIGTCILLCSCASGASSRRPPSMLVEARAAYTAAEHSGVVRYDPAALYAARMSLEHAEQLFREDADLKQVSDAAYVAMRRAQLAEVEGSIVQTKLHKVDLERDAQPQAKQSATRRVVREQPSPESVRADAILLELRSSTELTVAEQAQSTVITLPADPMFQTDGWALSPRAHDDLDKVAGALREQGERQILVVGYTDDLHNHSDSVALSRRRAAVVTEYLANHGVPRGKLISRGMGPNNPVASNNTEPGRSANCRVEISVQRFEPR